MAHPPRNHRGAGTAQNDLLVRLRNLSTAHREPDALQRSILLAFQEWGPYASLVLLILSQEQGAFVPACPDPRAAGLSLSADSRLVQWLEVNQQCLPVPDDAGIFSYLDESDRRLLGGARLCLPLIVADEVTAILLFLDDTVDRFSPDDMDFLLSCGRVAASALRAAGDVSSTPGTKRLHRADQLAAAGQLAATIAHEVRNPLSTIRSTIQYVIDSTSEWSHKRGLLKEMFREVDRIDQTIGGILTLARPSGLSLQVTDVTAVVREALRLVAPYAEEQQVNVEARLSVSLRALADPRELRQVFVNLILNACQAMPDGGHLTVETSRGPAEISLGLFVLSGAVTITDTGSGIDAALSDKIFEPFFTTKSGGTGLGLPVCLEIVSRHSGTLTLSAAESGGTRATVSLPLRET